MKSQFAPGECLFQIVVQDFKHRQPAPKNFYVDKSGKGVKEIVDQIPILTLFRRAKTGKQAIRSASKKGSVISCHKVDSHLRRLDMISHLRIEKPIFVDISVEEFIVGRELQVESLEKKTTQIVVKDT